MGSLCESLVLARIEQPWRGAQALTLIVQLYKILKKEGIAIPKKEDLSGKIFGVIQVIEPAPNKKQKTYWRCRCTICGKEKDIQTCHIKNGTIKTCGCKCNNSSQEKICELCGKPFFPLKNGLSRKFCFDCSPQGADRKERTNLKRQAAKLQAVQDLGGCCQKCGETRHYILAFHHVNPEDKTGAPSRFLANSQFNDFFEEKKKCILLCHNCHGEFHYLEAHEKITLEEYLK